MIFVQAIEAGSRGPELSRIATPGNREAKSDMGRPARGLFSIAVATSPMRVLRANEVSLLPPLTPLIPSHSPKPAARAGTSCERTRSRAYRKASQYDFERTQRRTNGLELRRLENVVEHVGRFLRGRKRMNQRSVRKTRTKGND